MINSKNNNKKYAVETGLKFDRSMVATGKESDIRLLIKLKREVDSGSSERNKLNIALVIDRSGSMHGMKLERVKDAAINFVEKMKDDDIVSVVSFDDLVTIDLPPAPVREHARSAAGVIKAMHSGGSTYLSGGYEAGFTQTKGMHKNGVTSRIILLTDGEANVGEIRLEALTGLAATKLTNGISTSTVGVGEGFNEQLLGAMAEAGMGNTYYIQTPEDAVSVFEEELGYLMQIGAKNVTVKIVSSFPGMSLGQFNKYPEKEPGKYLIGDLYGGKERTLLLEFGIPSIAQTGKVHLGEVQLNYDLVDGENLTSHTESFPLEIDVVSPEMLKSLSPDKEVTLALCNYILAKVKEEILVLLEHREYEKSVALVMETMDKIRAFGIEDPALERELRDLEERSRMIAEYREDYYMIDKKRLYYESSNMMTGKAYANLQMNLREESSGFNPLEKLKRTITRKKG